MTRIAVQQVSRCHEGEALMLASDDCLDFHQKASQIEMQQRTDMRLMNHVRCALGFDDRDEGDTSLTNDWDSMCEQMWTHRLGSLVWPQILSSSAELPSSAHDWITQFRNVTSRLNGANLLTMRRVLPRLEAEGIKTIAYKGPVLQQMAYQSVFMRPASDLDILVDISDFDRTGHVLSNLGYTMADVCRSVWWKAGLGEQHFLADNASDATLDLHHRVQQPGCPIPRYPTRFLDLSEHVSVAGHQIRTLSYTHSILLAAMSYVKALHHREPGARYVIDLTALARGLSSDGWKEVENEAELQGLRNTLALTVRVATLLLGSDTLSSGPAGSVLGKISDTTLIQMTLRPMDPAIQWPRRRELLHALCDNKLAYPAGLAAMVGSDLLRQAAERNKNKQQPGLREA